MITYLQNRSAILALFIKSVPKLSSLMKLLLFKKHPAAISIDSGLKEFFFYSY